MIENYILPADNVQISFSGGRSSAYLLHQILEANSGLPESAVVTFANTGREMPETLDFVQECQHRWGVKIHWLEYSRESKKLYKEVNYQNASRQGEPFEVLIKKRQYLPNIAARFCTTELKILPMKRFLTKQMQWKKWVCAVGLRADESHRAKTESKDRWSYLYPMIKASVTKQEIKTFWQRQSFDLKLSNASGSTPKGNCDFCFLKSESILATMAREHPDRVEWWVNMERHAGSTFRKGRDLREFVEFVNRQQDWVFDEAGFFCQADEGECLS